MNPPTVISKPTIQEFLFNAGIDVATAAVVMPDPRYALPDPDWIAGSFAKAFAVWRDQQLGVYAPGECDCDDFVEAATFYARLCYRRTPNRPSNAGVAFGEFYFQRNGTGYGHAVNVAICRGSDNLLHLVFFEPQTAQIVTLTKKEISSCNYFGM